MKTVQTLLAALGALPSDASFICRAGKISVFYPLDHPGRDRYPTGEVATIDDTEPLPLPARPPSEAERIQARAVKEFLASITARFQAQPFWRVTAPYANPPRDHRDLTLPQAIEIGLQINDHYGGGYRLHLAFPR